MAKVNPVKVKQEADKEEKAGRLDKAVQLHRQLLDENPRDWNTINKIGDLYAKMNRMQEAATEYAKVADFYARDGFHLKAIAIWKKINKLDATALDPYLKLAELYAKQGLMMEAKSQYQIVVDEYLKRGRGKEAGDVLRKMAEIDPADLKIRSKLADLYTREGSGGKAIEEMIAIAEELNRKGHLAEAVQVLEKGLKIDGSNVKLCGELARAYLVQKNFAKAAEFIEGVLHKTPDDTQALAQLGEAYLSGNRVDDAAKVFRRLIDLAPDNPEARAQMARLLLAQGKFDAAHDELAPAVDWFMERGEGDKASTLLQQILNKNPHHIKTLVKLVEVLRQLKNDRAVMTAYSQLTEAYIKGGQLDRAASVLEILISMEPANQQHQSKLSFVRSKMGGPAKTAEAAPEPELELPAAEPELTLEPEVPLALEAGAPAQSIEPSGPLSDEDREFIEEHLAEGKVFRKYGLIDKAADQFEAVIARFPDHLETRQELFDVYKEKEQPLQAAQQAVAIAQIHSLAGNAEAAEAAIAEARQLAPEAVPADWGAAAAEPAPTEPAEAPAEAEPELPLDQAEEEVSLAGAEEEIPLEVEEGGLEAEGELPTLEATAEVGFDAAPAEDELAFAAEPAVAEPTPGEDELGLASEELPLESIEEAPASDELGVGGDDLEALGEPALAAEEPELPEPELPEPELPEPEPEPVVPQVVPLRAAAAAPAATPAGPAVPADLRKVLDEVDSYMSLGFVDDAKDALREVRQRYPGHPAIQEKVAELGLDQEVTEPVAAAEPAAAAAPADDLGLGGMEEQPASLGDALEALAGPAPEEPGLGFDDAPPAPAEPAVVAAAPAPTPAEADAGFDLGAELGELFSAQSVEEPAAETAASELGDAGLAEIFKEFKKGVDKQLGKEDYDTRYNLGIAYKEMGLIDEAIAEFQLAAKDEARMLECSSMLGICFMDKGMPKLAVKWFEKGLKAPGRSDEEYQGLRYDLAMAHEASGETEKALNLYEDLYGQDANFRDVATKVRELRAHT